MEFTIQFIHPKISLLFHPSDTDLALPSLRDSVVPQLKLRFYSLHRIYRPFDILYNLVIYLFTFCPTSSPHGKKRTFVYLISAEIQILDLLPLLARLNLSAPQTNHS